MFIPKKENLSNPGLAEYSLFGSLVPSNSPLRDLTNQIATTKIATLNEKPISQELVDYGNHVKKWYENKARNQQKTENQDAFKPAKVIVGFEIKK